MTAKRFRLVATLAITLIFLLIWTFPILWSVLEFAGRPTATCWPIRRN